jgi:ribulose-phosphate 3-epimerase
MKASNDWISSLPSDRLLSEISLWSADLGQLSSEIARIDCFADIYHIDVADGHFSSDLLFFPDLVATVRRHTQTPLHVHLMVTDDILASQIERFAGAGADLVSIHAENRNIDDALNLIEHLEIASGLVLQLHTPIAAVAPYLNRIQVLTLLGTRIGIKGQGLDPAAESRMREAQSLLKASNHAHRVILAADGGIREQTVPALRRAGADSIVMGSLAFGAENLTERMTWVHTQRKEA